MAKKPPVPNPKVQGKSINYISTGTKRIPKPRTNSKVFPVEVTYKEPSTDLGLLIEYEASLANRQPVGPKGGKLKKKKRSRPHKVNGVRPTSG